MKKIKSKKEGYIFLEYLYSQDEFAKLIGISRQAVNFKIKNNGYPALNICGKGMVYLPDYISYEACKFLKEYKYDYLLFGYNDFIKISDTIDLHFDILVHLDVNEKLEKYEFCSCVLNNVDLVDWQSDNSIVDINWSEWQFYFEKNLRKFY